MDFVVAAERDSAAGRRDKRAPATSGKKAIFGGKHYGVYPCAMLPYQLVPSAIKVRMSILPAVAVIVGAPAVPHLTLVNVAVPSPTDAACFNNSTNDLPAVAVGIVNVQAIDAVNVAVCTVPFVSAMVLAVETVPIATTDST